MEDAEPVIGEVVVIPTRPGQIVVPELPVRDMLLQTWLAAQRSPNTRDAYERDVRVWFAYCDRFGLDALAPYRVVVDQFRNWLLAPDPDRKRTAPYADSTVARMMAACSSFYDYCLQESVPYVRDNPFGRARRPVVSTETEARGLSLDEIDALIAAAAEHPGPEGIMVRLLADTGLRVSEACSLTTDRLERQDGRLVMTVVRKGGRRQPIPIPEDIAQDIEAHVGTRRGPVFVLRNRQVTRQQVGTALVKMAEAAGIGHVHPHLLRHAVITQLLDADVSLRKVQDLAGHATPATTYRYDRARNRISESPVHDLAALRRHRQPAQ
jgi:integrase/recombinase XerD